MKTLHAFVNSFRTRVTLTLILGILIATALSNILICRFTIETQFNQLREKLMIIAQTSALMIDAEHTSIFAQIIATADADDAMTSARSYRPALSRRHAIGEVKKNAGAQFNPLVVEAFLRVVARGGTSYSPAPYGAPRACAWYLKLPTGSKS